MAALLLLQALLALPSPNLLLNQFALERSYAGAILLRSDWSSLLEWENGDDGEGIRLASPTVRHPNAAAQESGAGATRQSRWLRTADGFAVLSVHNSV
jgi:hypothetical protein